MDATLVGVFGLLVFVAILALGVPIGVAMGLVGFFGIYAMRGNAAWATLSTIPYSAMASWSLSVIPMYLLMGYLAFYAGMTKDAYVTAYKWLGRLPGGLALATLTGAAAFGAVCGSSIAATAALGKICLPEMKRFDYNMRLSAGCVATAGTLAALIPPSILLVLYGIITEQSVGKLLIAGILPGLLTMAAYQALVLLRAKLNPALAPMGDPVSWGERFRSLNGVLAIGLIFIIVVGGLYAGLLTPTDTGALGAFVALLIGLGMGRLRGKEIKLAVLDGLRSTSSIFLIVLGAYVFTQFLALSRVTVDMAEWTVRLPLPPMAIFGGIVLLYLILGCFLDALGLLLLTVPFIFPLVKALGIDPIWFGVIVVKLIEIGLLTPPVGIQAYVLKGVAPDLRLEDIWLGFAPFVVVDLVVVIGLLTLFPQIATFLPSVMIGK